MKMSKEFKSFHFDEMQWNEILNEKVGRSFFKKEMIKDDTGVMVYFVKYPAGFINPKHTHPHAHGIYVLKGIFHTSRGDFNPGSFLWFPEGEIMWHGATENADVELLFVTDKHFVINYL
jgi:quercetin dioxygenase-like cupin family protein